MPYSHGAAEPFASSRKRFRLSAAWAKVSAVSSPAIRRGVRAQNHELIDKALPAVELGESVGIVLRVLDQLCVCLHGFTCSCAEAAFAFHAPADDHGRNLP